jgi:hypothetical protein
MMSALGSGCKGVRGGKDRFFEGKVLLLALNPQWKEDAPSRPHGPEARITADRAPLGATDAALRARRQNYSRNLAAARFPCRGLGASNLPSKLTSSRALA